jgi:hypothetical protein
VAERVIPPDERYLRSAVTTTFAASATTANVPIDSQTFEAGEAEYSIEQRILDFLEENPQQAYNVREITVEVMDVGLSEQNVDRPSDVQTFMSEFVDLTTVSVILDRLVDNGRLERRLIDVGQGKRSYYRTKAR